MHTAEFIMAARQAANNYLLVMDLVLDGILALYVLSYVKAHGLEYALNMVRVRAAIWMSVHLVGLTLQRAWGVVLLRAFASGRDVMSIEAHLPIFFMGSVLAAIGLAGTIYTFTPLAGQDEPTLWQRIAPLALAIATATMFTVIMIWV